MLVVLSAETIFGREATKGSEKGRCFGDSERVFYYWAFFY